MKAWHLFLAASLSFLGGLILSTQVLALSLAYQPQLGAPLFIAGKQRIYNPASFPGWYLRYRGYAPKQFDSAANYAWGGLLLGALFLFAAARRCKKKPHPSSHGTAAWATEEELKPAGLLENRGIVLGLSKGGRYLRHDGPEHAMVLAPPRSGKGVGIIIPTLLTWPASVIVLDIKGENYGITAGYRRKNLNNKVLKFDPTAPGGGARFNPLAEIRIGTLQEVKDAQNVADILVDPQGTGQMDHWAKTGHALLVGTILHILYSKEFPRKDLTTVAAFLSDPERSIDVTLESMLVTEHDPHYHYGWSDIHGRKTKTHPVVAAAARELTNKAENERSGVLSTAMSLLGLYRDPLVSLNTCVSDFRISDLMNHENPVSLYLVVPPSDLNRTRPLMRMLINQIGRTLTESMEFKDGKPTAYYRHRLLLLLDEFPALGRLDFFESALAFLPGYGIKALLIAQNLNLLKKAYGGYNSLLDSCHVRVVHTPNDAETAELISRMLGSKTEIVTNRSFSGNRFHLWLSNMSHSTQEIARPLMTSGEVSVLPYGEEIIFLAGYPPIKAHKLFYYGDRNFLYRLMPAPEQSDVCRADVEPSATMPAVHDTGLPKQPAAPAPLPEKTEKPAGNEAVFLDEVLNKLRDATDATAVESNDTDNAAADEVADGSAVKDDDASEPTGDPKAGEDDTAGQPSRETAEDTPADTQKTATDKAKDKAAIDGTSGVIV